MSLVRSKPRTHYDPPDCRSSESCVDTPSPRGSGLNESFSGFGDPSVAFRQPVDSLLASADFDFDVASASQSMRLAYEMTIRMDYKEICPPSFLPHCHHASRSIHLCSCSSCAGGAGDLHSNAHKYRPVRRLQMSYIHSHIIECAGPSSQVRRSRPTSLA